MLLNVFEDLIFDYVIFYSKYVLWFNLCNQSFIVAQLESFQGLVYFIKVHFIFSFNNNS